MFGTVVVVTLIIMAARRDLYDTLLGSSPGPALGSLPGPALERSADLNLNAEGRGCSADLGRGCLPTDCCGGASVREGELLRAACAATCCGVVCTAASTAQVGSEETIAALRTELTAATAATAASMYEVLRAGHDCRGGDLSDTNVALDVCGDRCSATPGCTGFTFRPGHCILKALNISECDVRPST